MLILECRGVMSISATEEHFTANLSVFLFGGGNIPNHSDKKSTGSVTATTHGTAPNASPSELTKHVPNIFRDLS